MCGVVGSIVLYDAVAIGYSSVVGKSIRVANHLDNQSRRALVNRDLFLSQQWIDDCQSRRAGDLKALAEYSGD